MARRGNARPARSEQDWENEIRLTLTAQTKHNPITQNKRGGSVLSVASDEAQFALELLHAAAAAAAECRLDWVLTELYYMTVT